MTTGPSHAELMALDLPELRRRLAEIKGARPAQPYTPAWAEWAIQKDNLAFALECKEGELRSPAFTITVPAKPMEGLRVQPELDFKCMTPTRRHVRPQPLPEEPMPQPRKYHTPEEKRDAKKRRQREWLAKKRAEKSAAPPPATAPHASASPEAPADTRATTPRARSVAQPVAQGAQAPAYPTPEAAQRLRGLRSQALDLLPNLEDLSLEAAREAHDELDVLAQTLVLAGKLIARRIA